MLVFEDRAALAAQLARQTEAALVARLKARGSAMLAVSGGSTPGLLFQRLSAADLDWSRVTITLVDERWVPEDDPRSNAALVRRTLLVNQAAAARFIPLYNGAKTPESGLAAMQGLFAEQPLPFAAVILGMGEDGHTASFFPGGDHLDAALNPPPGRLLESMNAPGAGEPRITFTLPVLVQSDFMALHIEGERKRTVLEAAQKPGRDQDLPVRAVLRHAPEIFWCS